MKKSLLLLIPIIFIGLSLVLFRNEEQNELNKKEDQSVKAEVIPVHKEPVAEAVTEAEEVAENIEEEQKKIDVQKQESPQAISIEQRHQEILKQGNIYKIRNMEDLNMLAANTRYLTMTFFDNSCFANTQPSYNMIQNQPEMKKRVPDMIFVNIPIEQFPDLAKKFQVNTTPYTILIDQGQPVAGSPGYYDSEGLEKFMREFLPL
ncbi:thioredoxin family protein [Mesobacillus jeotgali]|uniref:thioredoxin family protein n=1 Tax=Mesobacillus jeotgali TaxID=129985 RepID=UPI000C841D91|nr:thioredoxin family protein [Mesobacillus jeotgali]